MKIIDKRYYEIKDKILPFMLYANQDIANKLRAYFAALHDGKNDNNHGLFNQAEKQINEILENKDNFSSTKLVQIEHFINEELTFDERLMKLEENVTLLGRSNKKSTYPTPKTIQKEDHPELSIYDVPDELVLKLEGLYSDIPDTRGLRMNDREKFYESSKIRWKMSVLINEEMKNKGWMKRTIMSKSLTVKSKLFRDHKVWLGIIKFSSSFNEFPEPLCHKASYSTIEKLFEYEDIDTFEEAEKLIMDGTIKTKKDFAKHIKKKPKNHLSLHV